MAEPVPVDPAEAGERIDDILSGAEYRPRSDSVLRRVFDWILDRDIFPDLPGTAGSGPGDLVATVFLVAIVVGIAYLVFVLIRDRRPRARPDTEEAVEYGTESHQRPSVWRREAERLSALGDHRGAVRCWHQLLLATWIEERTIDHVPGRTASSSHDEARRRAAVTPGDAAHDDSLVVTRTFDDVWYGARPVTGEQAHDFRARVERLAALRADGVATASRRADAGIGDQHGGAP